MCFVFGSVLGVSLISFADFFLYLLNNDVRRKAARRDRKEGAFISCHTGAKKEISSYEKEISSYDCMKYDIYLHDELN